MNSRWLAGFLALGFCSLPTHLRAGGSGLNVVVVVNQNSSNSVQLGSYYCEQRQVPPQNYLRINWTGGNTAWAISDFTNTLLNPLLAMLTSRQLTNQIDFVVLSMDIPFQVIDYSSGSYNGTTSALFYGFKPDTNPPLSCLPNSCSLPDYSSNSYAFSELAFEAARTNLGCSNSFLAMMITGPNLAAAKLIVDQGVASDATFPTQTVYLAKTYDLARNVRFVLFDNAIFATRLRGDYSMQRTNSDSPAGQTNFLGYQTGLAALSVSANAFVPGAMADSLTSYGGVIFGPNGQTTELAFTGAGAAGSYGTVVEPCNYTQKFPDPRNYFYQARGFSLAEAYYQSLQNPYQGLLVGEPLASPFASPASAVWISPTNNSVLGGFTSLQIGALVATDDLPLNQADLFIDGNFFQTVTNIVPAAGNILSVTINGFTVHYTVPPNATLATTAAGLATALNAQSNITYVQVSASGDRLDLRSFNEAMPGSNVTLSAGTAIGSASQLTTRLTPARSTFLDTIATGYHGVLVSNTPVMGDWLRFDFIKTNGTHVTVAVTNLSGSDVGSLTQSLLNLINSNTALQSADGVTAADFYDNAGACGQVFAQFNLYANSPGWAAAQIELAVSSSTNLEITPSGTNSLQDNLPDLQPRNHLYITAGVTNLSLTFPFNTATQANGFHDLTAVVYEGSHVRTQRAATQSVQIQNGGLSATLTTLVGASNTLVGTTLQFSVIASSNIISRVTLIQLFSTGGLLASATNQSSAVFSVPGTNLDVGLHPVYAIVTTTLGQQYRTQTQWIRLIDTPDAPFTVAIAAPPPTLSWPATAGRTYNILSTTNLTLPFQFSAAVTPSNSAAQWTDTTGPAPRRFYRVQTAD